MLSRRRPTPVPFPLALLVWLVAFAVLLPPPLFAAVAISVNGAQRFQTIDGFGVNANSASWNNGELRPALDMLVDQAGATIWRVIIDDLDWETTNDNSDPNTFNWTYYNSVYTSAKFEKLWSTIAYLNQKGITSQLMLNFMGPAATWMGGSQITASAEDELVEMISSAVYYGRITRGLQIGLLAPMNETDWDGIEGPQVGSTQYVRILHKLAQKLDAIGLGGIRLVGPDTADVNTGVNTYIAEMMRDSVVMAKVNRFGLHNYSGATGGADAFIKSSAFPDRGFWMTEVSLIGDIISMVRQGPAAILVWDAYDSVYNHATLAGRGTTPPNDAGNGPALLAYNTTTKVYTPRRIFYDCAHLFKFVAPGSQRIGASPSSGSVTIDAFHHQGTGQLTLFGRNTSTTSQVLTGTLNNLTGVTSFRFYQTSAAGNLQQGSDVSVGGNTFTVTVAANSTFTLTTAGQGPRPTGPPRIIR
jgi:O-glycosyl hydrolase